MSSLTNLLLKGDRKAISKAITSVENRDERYPEILREVYPHTGRAFVVGITGPPGTGKSTLVNQLVRLYRKRGKKVAVIAVDPSSPVSGGAILGDRVRMIGHTLDSGVYIRSMASRGDAGGLSRAAKNAVRILDAAGNDVVFVETVGIGQTEVEIVKVADAVVVVLMPELGDEIQAIKAGLMEIGDIFAVNKSDLPGADKIIYNLDSVLVSKVGWRQSAVKVSAKTGEGLEELMRTLDECKDFVKKSEAISSQRKKRLSEELIENVTTTVVERLASKLAQDAQFEDLVERVNKRQIDPESATRMLLEKYVPKTSDRSKESFGKKKSKVKLS